MSGITGYFLATSNVFLHVLEGCPYSFRHLSVGGPAGDQEGPGAGGVGVEEPGEGGQDGDVLAAHFLSGANQKQRAGAALQRNETSKCYLS